MTKGYALAVVLLLSLPACGPRKEKKEKSTTSSTRNTVNRYMENGDVELTGEEEEGEEEEPSEEEIMTLFESLGEEEDLSEMEPSNDLTASMEQNFEEGEEFSWVDAQADDEFKTVYFDFNHYNVKDDQKKWVEHDIQQAKQILAEVDTQATPLIVIEGHACQEGAPAYNVSLSEKRAKNVADLFVAAGIDQDNIKVVGRGQEVPAVINGKVVNGTREERAPNRRVEVRVIYT